MPSGGNLVTDFKVYYCGYCTNNLHRVIKNAPNQKLKIPAAAVLLRHNENYYLFDTGYAPRVLEGGWRSKLYHTLNPVVVTGHNTLASQLASEGIRPADIKGIVLSHLHPDHIGGLLDFPNSKLFISSHTYQIYQKPAWMDLVFSNLLPTDFNTRVKILDIDHQYDLFGDGSVLLKDVSGHTKGQTGMFLQEHNTFFAADSCWRLSLLANSLNALGRALQNNYKAYQETANKIAQMQKSGIRVVLSHEVRP